MSTTKVSFMLLLAVTALLTSCERHIESPDGNAPAIVAGEASSFQVGHGPSTVALADLNSDGLLDLMVAHERDNDAAVFFGNGQGGFRLAIGSIPAGRMPSDIALADFNSDHKLDAAFANHETSSATVLLGNGAGGFSPAAGSPFLTGSRPHIHSVAAGDFDLDGTQDLVFESADTDAVQVLRGDGRGGFASPRSFAAGNQPYFRVRAGDLDGDGHPEVVVAAELDDAIAVLTPDGRGDLVPVFGSPFPAGRRPFNVAIGDFNGDGRQDLAAVAEGNAVPLLLREPNGGYSPAPGSPFRAGEDPTNLAVGDINSDGVMDLAVSNYSSNDVTLFLSRGRAFAPEVQRLPVGRRPQQLILGDLNRDGRADLVVACYLDDAVYVWISQ